MLSQENRIKNYDEFSAVIKNSVGIRTPDFMVYIVNSMVKPAHLRAGFIVSKKVGNAVTRNLVKRRLRAIFAELDKNMPVDIVIRAFPRSADSDFSTMKKFLLKSFDKYNYQHQCNILNVSSRSQYKENQK